MKKKIQISPSTSSLICITPNSSHHNASPFSHPPPLLFIATFLLTYIATYNYSILFFSFFVLSFIIHRYCISSYVVCLFFCTSRNACVLFLWAKSRLLKCKSMHYINFAIIILLFHVKVMAQVTFLHALRQSIGNYSNPFFVLCFSSCLFSNFAAGRDICCVPLPWKWAKTNTRSKKQEKIAPWPLTKWLASCKWMSCWIEFTSALILNWWLLFRVIV